MPKAYPCNARFNNILFGAGSEDRTRTNRVKICCPAVRLFPYEVPLFRGAFFVFCGFFGIGASDLLMVFFIFGGIGGTQTKFQKLP